MEALRPVHVDHAEEQGRKGDGQPGGPGAARTLPGGAGSRGRNGGARRRGGNVASALPSPHAHHREQRAQEAAAKHKLLGHGRQDAQGHIAPGLVHDALEEGLVGVGHLYLQLLIDPLEGQDRAQREQAAPHERGPGAGAEVGAVEGSPPQARIDHDREQAGEHRRGGDKLPLLTAGHLLRQLGGIDVVQIHIDEGDKSVDHHLNDEKDDEDQ